MPDTGIIIELSVTYIVRNGFPDIVINFYQQGYHYGFANASILTYLMILTGIIAPICIFILMLLLITAGYFPTVLFVTVVFWILFYFLYQFKLYLLLVILVIAYSSILFWWSYQSLLLKDAIHRFAKGENSSQIDTELFTPAFKEQANELYLIKETDEEAAQKSILAERLQGELITNVSHDIKTPLTSIINYIHLLQHVDNPELSKNYLAVLQKQADRLRRLTENLVEASKVSTGNVTANITPLDIDELLEQAIGEYTDKFEMSV